MVPKNDASSLHPIQPIDLFLSQYTYFKYHTNLKIGFKLNRVVFTFFYRLVDAVL